MRCTSAATPPCLHGGGGKEQEQDGKSEDPDNDSDARALVKSTERGAAEETDRKEESGRRARRKSLHDERCYWGVCITGDKKGRIVVWHLQSLKTSTVSSDRRGRPAAAGGGGGTGSASPQQHQQQGKVTSFTPLANQSITALAVVRPCCVHTPVHVQGRLEAEAAGRFVEAGEEEEGKQGRRPGPAGSSPPTDEEMCLPQEAKAADEVLLNGHITSKVDIAGDRVGSSKAIKKLADQTPPSYEPGNSLDSLVTAVGYGNGSVVLVKVSTQHILRILGRQGEEISALVFVALPIPRTKQTPRYLDKDHAIRVAGSGKNSATVTGRSDADSKGSDEEAEEKVEEDVENASKRTDLRQEASPVDRQRRMDAADEKKEQGGDHVVGSKETKVSQKGSSVLGGEAEGERGEPCRGENQMSLTEGAEIALDENKEKSKKSVGPDGASTSLSFSRAGDEVVGEDRGELRLCLLSGSRDGQVFLWSVSGGVSGSTVGEGGEEEEDLLLTTVCVGETKSSPPQKGPSRGSQKTPARSQQETARSTRETQRQWLSACWHPSFPSDIFFGVTTGQLLHWRPGAAAAAPPPLPLLQGSGSRKARQANCFSGVDVKTPCCERVKKLLQPHTRPIFSLSGFAFTVPSDRLDPTESKNRDQGKEKENKRGEGDVKAEIQGQRHLLLLSTSMDRTLCLTDINVTSPLAICQAAQEEPKEKEQTTSFSGVAHQDPKYRGAAPPHLNTSLLWQLNTLGGWITSLALSPLRPSQLLAACGDSTVRSLDLLQLLHQASQPSPISGRPLGVARPNTHQVRSFSRDLEARGIAALRSRAVSSGLLWKGLLASVESVTWHPLLPHVFAFGLGDGSFGVGVLVVAGPDTTASGQAAPGGGGFSFANKCRLPLQQTPGASCQNDVVILSEKSPLQHKVTQLQWLLLPSLSEDDGRVRDHGGPSSSAAGALRQASYLSLSEGPVSGLMASPVPSALISGTDEGELLITTFCSPSSAAQAEDFHHHKQRNLSSGSCDFESVRSGGISPCGPATGNKRRQGEKASSGPGCGASKAPRKSVGNVEGRRYITPVPVPLLMYSRSRPVPSGSKGHGRDLALHGLEGDAAGGTAASLVAPPEPERVEAGRGVEEDSSRAEKRRQLIEEAPVRPERLSGLPLVMRDTLSFRDVHSLLDGGEGESRRGIGKERPRSEKSQNRQEDHVAEEGEGSRRTLANEAQERSSPKGAQRDSVTSNMNFSETTGGFESHLSGLACSASGPGGVLLCIVRPSTLPSSSCRTTSSQARRTGDSNLGEKSDVGGAERLSTARAKEGVLHQHSSELLILKPELFQRQPTSISRIGDGGGLSSSVNRTPTPATGHPSTMASVSFALLGSFILPLKDKPTCTAVLASQNEKKTASCCFCKGADSKRTIQGETCTSPQHSPSDQKDSEPPLLSPATLESYRSSSSCPFCMDLLAVGDAGGSIWVGLWPLVLRQAVSPSLNALDGTGTETAPLSAGEERRLSTGQAKQACAVHVTGDEEEKEESKLKAATISPTSMPRTSSFPSCIYGDAPAPHGSSRREEECGPATCAGALLSSDVGSFLQYAGAEQVSKTGTKSGVSCLALRARWLTREEKSESRRTKETALRQDNNGVQVNLPSHTGEERGPHRWSREVLLGASYMSGVAAVFLIEPSRFSSQRTLTKTPKRTTPRGTEAARVVSEKLSPTGPPLASRLPPCCETSSQEGSHASPAEDAPGEWGSGSENARETSRGEKSREETSSRETDWRPSAGNGVSYTTRSTECLESEAAVFSQEGRGAGEGRCFAQRPSMEVTLVARLTSAACGGLGSSGKPQQGGGGGGGERGFKSDQQAEGGGGALLACCWYEQPLPNRLILVLGGVEQTIFLWDPLALPVYPRPIPSFPSPCTPPGSTGVSSSTSSCAISASSLPLHCSSPGPASVSTNDASPQGTRQRNREKRAIRDPREDPAAEEEGTSSCHSGAKVGSTRTGADQNGVSTQGGRVDPPHQQQSHHSIGSRTGLPVDRQNEGDPKLQIAASSGCTKQDAMAESEEGEEAGGVRGKGTERKDWRGGGDEGGILPPWLDLSFLTESELLRILCSLLLLKKGPSRERLTGSTKKPFSCRAFTEDGRQTECLPDPRGQGATQDKSGQERKRRGMRAEGEEEEEGGTEATRAREEREGTEVADKHSGAEDVGNKEELDKHSKDEERRRAAEGVLLYFLSGRLSPLAFFPSFPLACIPPSLDHSCQRAMSNSPPFQGDTSPAFYSRDCDGHLCLAGQVYTFHVSKDKRPSSPWLRLLHLWLSSSSSRADDSQSSRPPVSSDGLYSCLLLNGQLPWMSTSPLDSPWKEDNDNTADSGVLARQLGEASSVSQRRSRMSPYPSSAVSLPTSDSMGTAHPADAGPVSPFLWLALAGSAGACDGRSPHAARAWRAVVCSFVNHRLREVDREKKRKQKGTRLTSSGIVHECSALLLSIGAAQEAITAYRRCGMYGHALLLARLALGPALDSSRNSPFPYHEAVPSRKRTEEGLGRHSSISLSPVFQEEPAGEKRSRRTYPTATGHGPANPSSHRNQKGHGPEQDVKPADRRRISKGQREAEKKEGTCQSILLEWAEYLAKKGDRLAACVAVASADAWLIASSLLLEEASSLHERTERTYERQKASETALGMNVMDEPPTPSRRLALLVLATRCAIKGAEGEPRDLHSGQRRASQGASGREEGDEEGQLAEGEGSTTNGTSEDTTGDYDDQDHGEEDEGEAPSTEDQVFQNECLRKTSGSSSGAACEVRCSQPRGGKRSAFGRRTAYPTLMGVVTSHFPGLIEQVHVNHPQAPSDQNTRRRRRRLTSDDCLSSLLESPQTRDSAEVLWRAVLVPLHLRVAAYLADLGASFAEQAFHVSNADWTSAAALHCWHSTVAAVGEQEKTLESGNVFSGVSLLGPLLNSEAENVVSTWTSQAARGGREEEDHQRETKQPKREGRRRWRSTPANRHGRSPRVPATANEAQHREDTASEETGEEEKEEGGLQFVRQALQGHRAVFAANWCLASLQKELSGCSSLLTETKMAPRGKADDEPRAGGSCASALGECRAASGAMAAVGLEWLFGPSLNADGHRVISRDTREASVSREDRGSVCPSSLYRGRLTAPSETRREGGGPARSGSEVLSAEGTGTLARVVSLLEDLTSTETFAWRTAGEKKKDTGTDSGGISDDNKNADNRFECVEGEEHIRPDARDRGGGERREYRAPVRERSSFLFEMRLFSKTGLQTEAKKKSAVSPSEDEKVEQPTPSQEDKRTDAEGRRTLLKSAVLLACALLSRCQLRPSCLEILPSSVGSPASREDEELIRSVPAHLRVENRPGSQKATSLGRQKTTGGDEASDSSEGSRGSAPGGAHDEEGRRPSSEACGLGESVWLKQEERTVGDSPPAGSAEWRHPREKVCGRRVARLRVLVPAIRLLLAKISYRPHMDEIRPNSSTWPRAAERLLLLLLRLVLVFSPHAEKDKHSVLELGDVWPSLVVMT